jgi:kynurenine formamidase
VRAVGIDTASIDRGRSTTYDAHRVLAAAGVPIFENVARLDALPPRGARVIALPMKIAGGTGGPLRIVAVLPEP